VTDTPAPQDENAALARRYPHEIIADLHALACQADADPIALTDRDAALLVEAAETLQGLAGYVGGAMLESGPSVAERLLIKLEASGVFDPDTLAEARVDKAQARADNLAGRREHAERLDRVLEFEDAKVAGLTRIETQLGRVAYQLERLVTEYRDR